MKRQKKKSDAKLRTTTDGTPVRILSQLGDGIYLVEAITRKGVYTTQVSEEDLEK